MACSALIAALVAPVATMSADGATVEPIRPVIEGDWWTLASTPELPAEYQSEKPEPVDFAVWQAADGTWQLWSCIRHTNCGGHSRLFYGWEGQNLSDSNWRPLGIRMEGRPEFGEAAGGLQAPHVIKLDDQYLMAYGDWENICFATSPDGKNFERIVQPDGRTGVFGEGSGANTRDPMLIRINGLWHCYYTAISHGKGYGFCRTSPDLKQWSNSCVVSYGGRVGPNPWFNECPHVVEVLPGEFIYFRNQYYGDDQTNWAYYSTNPLNFGIDDDIPLVACLPVAAPEIIFHEGRYYIASLKPGLNGIQAAPLGFYRMGGIGKTVFDFDDPAGRENWRVTEGRFDMIFCDSPHADYAAPSRFVIGTAETSKGTYDDAMTGVIESPPFTLTEDCYYLLVGGGNDPENLYVAVIEDETNRELARFTGAFTNILQRKTFAPFELKGRQVKIRIVDHSKNPWGHINFGGIYVEEPRTPVR